MRAFYLIGLLLLEGAPSGLGQPVITTQPVSQTRWVGSRLSLSVAASGAGPLTYQWQLNGTNVPNDIISTFAGGGGVGDGGAATNANLVGPSSVAVDPSGDLFIADPGNYRVRKVGPDGIITTVAGSGANGSQPTDFFEGGAAVETALGNAVGLATDGSGNLFIAEVYNGFFCDSGRVCKVDTNGFIFTIAGGGVAAPVDGMAATYAVLGDLYSLAVDGFGNCFVAESGCSMGQARVYRIDTNGILMVVAGGGTNYPGNLGLATDVQLGTVHGLTVDSFDNLYLADTFNNRICKVDTNGLLTTVAGDGVFGYSGDGGPATNASLANPVGLALDGLGNLLFEDVQNNSIRKVSADGLIATVAGYGNPTNTFSGDGGAATNAGLALGFANVAVGDTGNLFIADTINNRVRQVDARGTITTFAGGGMGRGDGNLATNASLANPLGLTLDGSGNLFIADSDNNRIREVNAQGIITTVAGNGNAGFFGDGGAATNAGLSTPLSVAADAFGNLFIADQGNNRVAKIDTNGIIATLAGNGTNGFAGDGSTATQATLNFPQALALDTLGNLYIADTGNHRIRKIDTHSIITTIAGNGTNGFSGDGLAATNASLAYPQGLVVDETGNLFIADTGNNSVRRVDTNGLISTVIHDLNSPSGLALDHSGNLLIAEPGNNWIRKVNANGGDIETVAGGGGRGYLGDGGPAADAGLSWPNGVAVDSSGTLFIADASNNRIRKVAAGSSPVLTMNTVSSNAAGNYQVVISSPGGSVTSQVATLTVASTPLIFEPTPPADGTLALNFLSQPGSSNVLFSTTNLNPPVFWEPLTTIRAGNDGAWQFTDTNSALRPARFFRSITGWQPWVAATVPAPSSWLSLAASADGTKLIAAGYPGYPWNYDPWTGPPNATWAQTKISVSSVKASLYLSSDSGATWTRCSAPSNYWISVASSADGTKLAALSADYQEGKPGSQTLYAYGSIYVSIDSGATWTQSPTPSVSWSAESSVAISADGSTLAATAYYGGARVYTEANPGGPWVWRTGLDLPNSVLGAMALSADGKIIVAGEATGSNAGGPIHRSLDGGATWTTTSAPSNVWSSIACSGNGQKLVAATGFGYGNRGPLYTSSDSGATWTQTSAPNQAWSSVACSQDGTKIVAAAYDGTVYVSTDSGSTWSSAFAPGEIWSSVAWSDKGDYITAVSVGGTISRVHFPVGLYWP